MCLKIFVFVFCLTNSYLDAATIHSREKRGKFQVDSFLEDFGYMDQLGDTGGGHDSSDRERAVREFQKMVGLPVTGELNKATVKKMKAPRCGFRDVLRPSERPAELNNGPKKVKLMPLSNEYKWQDNRVTWKIMGYTGQLDRSLQRQSYINAFKKWSDVANLDIKEVGSGHADILIKYTRGDHYDGSPFDGRGRNLAHAFFPGTADLSGDTHFDDDEQWTLGTNEGTNLEIVAAHEFGHALGLGHSADRNALMAPYYNGYDANYKLGSDDIYRMRRLYGNDGRSTRIINQTPAPYRLVEGGDLSLICVYEGNGTETIDKNKIKFDKDGIDIPIDDEFRESVVTGSDTVTLTLMSSRPNGLEIQDAGKYQCSYERETSFKIVEVFDIEYTENAQVPVIPEKDKDKVEKKVELECKARFSQLTDAADEVYTLEWFKGGKNVKEVAGLKDRCTFGTNNVTINDVVRKDMGEYQCVFVFSNDDRINQTVQLTAPPEIEKTFTKSKNLVQGDDWTVVCPVTGFPYPIVYWTKDGEELNVEDDKRIQIEDNGNIKNSKLVIFSLTFEDKGEYSCHANSTTSFNSTMGTISLRVEDRLAALWPFLGIVAGVIILCIIIFIYKKKKSK